MNLADRPAAAAAAAMAAAPPTPEGPPPDASSIRLSRLKFNKGPVGGCVTPPAAPATAVVEADEPAKTLAVVVESEPLPGAMADLLPPVAPSKSLISRVKFRLSVHSKLHWRGFLYFILVNFYLLHN